MPRAGGGSGDGWLPLASGLLLPLGFAPVSLPFLPYVGLAPFLVWLSRPRAPGALLRGGLAFGIPYFAGSLYGMASLVRFTSAGLPGFLGILLLHLTTFFIVPVAFTLLRSRLPLALAAPPLWILSEHARSYGDLAFPWVTLGHAPAEWPILIQHADLVGVWGLSFLLVLANALLADLWLHLRAGRPCKAVAGGLLLVVGLPIAYGAARWPTIETRIASAPTLDVAIVQPNVEQARKWTVSAAGEVLARLNGLVARAEAGNPDLVIGPEACLPMAVAEGALRLPDGIAAGTRPLLLGVVTGLGEGTPRQAGPLTYRVFERHRNSAVLAGPDRTMLGRHDKQLLVPVTEQIPYSRFFHVFLPFMSKQFGRFVPADHLQLLVLPRQGRPIRLGALICYETLFPSLARRMRSLGADLLVTVTNDAWFGRTSFPYQHAAFSALRAVESRIAVVRCANSGISVVYDPLGRASQATGLYEEAVVRASVPLTRGLTVYDRVGDVVLWLSYLGSALLLARAWRDSGRP